MSEPSRYRDKAEELLALPTDAARAALCRAWQAEANAKWSQGQREMIADVVNSRSPRYRQFSRAERERIGRQKWSTSPTQKSLANDEQMFSRWAIMYGVAR